MDVYEAVTSRRAVRGFTDMGTVRRVCRNVKYWRSPSMALRWTGAAMQEAAKGFRRLKAHKQLPLLKDALTKHKAKAVPSNEHLAQTAKAP